LLAQEFQAELHLLHVLPVRAKSRAPEIALLPANAVISFDEAADRLQRSIPKEIYSQCRVKHILYEGEPYRRVLNYSEDQSIDLICMGASGTGFGTHSLFGSNSDRVLRQAPCPVLIARPLKPTMASVGAALA
jgi:nucleotide-binding universal stress UspA family protein